MSDRTVEHVKLVADIINRIGFPIVVCVFLSWLVLFKMEEQKTVTVAAMTGVKDALNSVAVEIKGLSSYRDRGRH